ncbi:MAG: Gfo/Idh/MocA family oxidoreductase [Armatimonadetes bacterium]|nr:Gfo/Idh/MocA family oxidoreductase [Armatimonadota bacterium]
MSAVRVGVVGCGVIGPTHMQAAVNSPHIELVAVADLIDDRAKAAAEKFNVPRVYREGAELIQDPDIDLVVLAFPAAGRTELGLETLKAGKHLLTEKPVAMNADEVRQLMAAQGNLLAGACCCRYRFTESARAATDFIASGALGQLRNVYCRELRPAGAKPSGEPVEWRLKKHRNGGGILMNWGCYDLDYLLGLCGWQLVPETVFAQTWTCSPTVEHHISPGSDAETYYTALVRCKGGTMLSIERGEYMAISGEAAWQIIGTKGSLRLHMLTSAEKKIIFDELDPDEGLKSRVIWEGAESSFACTPVEDMAKAILDGTKPATSLDRALVIQQISDGVYASATSGRCVSIA